MATRAERLAAAEDIRTGRLTRPEDREKAAALIEEMQRDLDAEVPVDVADRLRTRARVKLDAEEAADLDGVLTVIEVLRGVVEMRDQTIAALEAELAKSSIVTRR